MFITLQGWFEKRGSMRETARLRTMPTRVYAKQFVERSLVESQLSRYCTQGPRPILPNAHNQADQRAHGLQPPELAAQQQAKERGQTGARSNRQVLGAALGQRARRQQQRHWLPNLGSGTRQQGGRRSLSTYCHLMPISLHTISVIVKQPPITRSRLWGSELGKQPVHSRYCRRQQLVGSCRCF